MREYSIEEALKKHTGALMKTPGVVGTGQGVYHDKPYIKIFVTELTKELKKKIPEYLEGYQIIIEETGMFKAL